MHVSECFNFAGNAKALKSVLLLAVQGLTIRGPVVMF